MFTLYKNQELNEIRECKMLIYTWEDGGGTAICGVAPTEEVCWLLEEEILAKQSFPSLSGSIYTCELI